jgi:hypothetical protein
MLVNHGAVTLKGSRYRKGVPVPVNVLANAKTPRENLRATFCLKHF